MYNRLLLMLDPEQYHDQFAVRFNIRLKDAFFMY